MKTKSESEIEDKEPAKVELTPVAVANQKPATVFPPNIPVPMPAPESQLPKPPGQSPDDSEYGGLYRNVNDGELYAVAIVKSEDAREGSDGKLTHFAKNTVHFWNGTDKQFREVFDKQ